METDGHYTYHGDQFIRYINIIRSLCCIHETEIILCINYTLINKKTKKPLKFSKYFPEGHFRGNMN